MFFFFFSSRRRHTRSDRDWSSDVCSSDLAVTRGPQRDGEPDPAAGAGNKECLARKTHGFLPCVDGSLPCRGASARAPLSSIRLPPGDADRQTEDQTFDNLRLARVAAVQVVENPLRLLVGDRGAEAVLHLLNALLPPGTIHGRRVTR